MDGGGLLLLHSISFFAEIYVLKYSAPERTVVTATVYPRYVIAISDGSWRGKSNKLVPKQ